MMACRMSNRTGKYPALSLLIINIAALALAAAEEEEQELQLVAVDGNDIEWGSSYSEVYGLSDKGICELFVDPIGTYSCQEYNVTTDDGFILGVQRISTKAAAAATPTALGHPVFLMHGVLQGGQNWLLNLPDENLPLILADAGFDVWIGNGRGTLYSHGHEKYTAKDKQYWDWSVDELASKDLVAMLNTVHTNSNYSKVHYIGFSQGTQAAFAALSQGLLTDVLDKIVMMGPVAYVEHTSCKLAQIALLLHLDGLLAKLKVYSFRPKTDEGKSFMNKICGSKAGCYKAMKDALSGHNCCLNKSRIEYYEKYETQPTSMKNLLHLAQGYRHGTFGWYDYGKYENEWRYNSKKAPLYDLSKVPTSNMLLIHSERDSLADPKDVKNLKKSLTPGFQTILIESYAHHDFLFAYNAKDLVYPHILNFLNHT